MHQEIFGVKKHFELKFTIYAIMETFYPVKNGTNRNTKIKNLEKV